MKEQKKHQTRIIIYWIATALVIFQLGSGGVGDVLRLPAVIAGMTHLGYPVYFSVILGIWKILGAIAIAVPGQPRLKEWAYAGAVFDLSGAAFSHLAVGDSAVKLIGPLLFLAFAVISWALRPEGRRYAALA
ncbi:DoxX family protein [Chitinophaga eiseniae]|uniref:DoxX family protein n=1 Tax=Chitinophaga eiseniae TaxID=634771 RepID=A0A847SS86_9BACT|nr:DoxX family protein [Chitinophaga eiseniae]NLR80406.1 DoxX family protein [Chitinophaga eiseniae]